ncbi:phage tail protein [Serratia plymuthica]|uniref:Tail fiber protein n=1 Tax=Serratia plymuthica TaxID=82996 RepID=A0A7T2WAQ8_SERPL|nr:phage tail protein [Serratia plymuthica]QPS20157.1 tail fiber protein [Serratia plymuthica]QPS61772.1 tail fiber protein [Serratia plymuthica]RKS61140.1 hypothetical protein C8E17_0250 [Serratia plymuthica]CAI2475379.1 Uncharacterised protein [Serratia plymuthica]
MTDKTPQNKVETPATFAGTTDTTGDSEPKSRALPQADALKARFKAGSIPLQTDFADLIDLANIGRQAVGGAEGQTGPANGLTLSSTGRLELKPNTAKGINVDKDGVSVKSGNGVAVNSSGVNVKLAKGANNNGGGGQGADGFTSIGSAGGLALSSNGLSVDAGNGIKIDSKGVSIKLAANSGLSADETNGLKIVPEQMFQKGMVMMFAGTTAEIPKGWDLCDGGNGRPDLRDRFIVGKGSKFTGKGEGTTSTSQTTVTGSVNVKDTKLTLSQIPSHSHNYYKIEYRSFGYYYGNSRQGMIDSNSSVSTSSSGGSMGHKHDATLNINSHQHSIDPIPPYYALAFIIKL